ncbi:hypothetical protein ACHAXA_010965 [Cyclostephanos tholiformis]|uniref:Peptidase M50 domain-containing protein n=1 Tax=Cyclostephanos tholiformis TaxID=382380 RepID=A0ABD3RZU8_9STRA
MMPPVARQVMLILIVLTVTSSTLAFQQPTKLVHVRLHHGGTIRASWNKVGLLSKSDESKKDIRLPFLATALQKLQSETKGPDLIDESEFNNDLDCKQIDPDAAILRALAMKTRLEAEKLEISLTLAKIKKIEEMTSEKDERAKILRDIQLLTAKTSAVGKGKGETEISSYNFSRDDSLKISDSTQEGEKKLFPPLIPIPPPNQVTTVKVVQEILDGDKPLLRDEQRQDAISSFDKLPQQIKDMMARTVGLNDGTNSTAVIDRLMKEDRLYEGDDDGKFSIRAKADDFDDVEIFINTDFAEVNAFVRSLLPESTRKKPLKEEYIDTLFSEVLRKDTFNPTERKPQAVPGGYLIRGESRVKSKEGMNDGDLLIEALDRKIAVSSLAGKIQVFYILDPTPPSGEEILNDEDESPVLLITNYDISPDTKPWVKPTVTFLGLASIAVFTLGSFAFNEDVINRVSASANSDNSFDWLYSLSLPLALPLLATQISHEFGHLIVAVKNDIEIGLPSLIPSFQFGLTGCITPIRSSPKNIKSLFDFAIAGPLFGLTASLILLYTGLEMTAFMDTSSLAKLPSIPVEILRSSALGGGIIDYLLGDGVLKSPDPSQMIKLHPYAIAGFSGLMINALSLLPIGNTDGGRISLTFFGRSFSRVVQGTALLTLIVAGFFGIDQMNIFLCYAIFCQIWQRDLEVPCRNEVDELDSVRGFIAIVISLIVILTLIPLP